MPSPWQSAVLFLSSLAATIALAAPKPSPEPTLVLPKLEVTAHVPIVPEATLELHEARFGAAVVADGNYLYILGGSNESGSRLATNERVDLRTGRVEQWGRLIVARRHHRAVILGDAIYVLGGTSAYSQKNNGLVDELSEYDDNADAIVDAASAHNRGTSDLMGTDTDRKLKGGVSASASASESWSPFEYETTVERISLATGRSELVAPMPVGKALFGCVVLDGKIYVMGGQRRRGDYTSSTNTTEVYDAVSAKWSQGINMPTPRRCVATVVDNFAVVVGGHEGLSRVATVEVFNPREKVWRRLPELSERCDPSAVVWAGPRLLLFGDQATARRQLAYDLRTKQLSPYPLALPNGNLAAAVVHAGKVYVVGGVNFNTRTANPAVQVFALAPEPPLSPAEGR